MRHNLNPTKGRTEGVSLTEKRFTRHEVAALRAGGPSGRTHLAGKPHRNPSQLQFSLQLPRIHHAKMKNTSRKRSIRLAASKNLYKMRSTSGST